MANLSPPSKFAQRNEDPEKRNINFEAFNVIQDISGQMVESLVEF